MVELTVVNNHSVCLDLLTKGPVLDAGCRGFEFATFFAKRGHPVVMLDPAPDVKPPREFYDLPVWSHFYPAALVGPAHPSTAQLRMTDDPEARHVTFAQDLNDPQIRCMKLFEVAPEVTQWDLIKLNIEGSEYDVLQGINGPIARQIVFSFHEHTQAARGQATCDRIIEHLKQWYDVFNVVWEKRYGCSENYWDCVAILKGLVK